MKRQTVLILAVLLAAVIAAICITVVLWGASLDDQVYKYPKFGLLSGDTETGSFKIDPMTILPAVERGDTNVFLPATGATPSSWFAGRSVSWSQSEFLSVAVALHQFVWKESLDGWSIYGLRFRLRCRDDPRGFEYADFVLFKPAEATNTKAYSTRELIIEPWLGEVSWGGGATYPRPASGWDSFPLGDLKVAGETALILAEADGGKVFRESIKNACKIIIMEDLGRTGVWKVAYYPNDIHTRNLFKFIDAFSGGVIQ